MVHWVHGRVRANLIVNVMEAFVIVGTYDCSVVCLSIDLLSPEENGLRRRFCSRGHSGSVRTVATWDRWVASGSSDETIKLYDLSKCSEIGSLLQHEGSVSWLSFGSGRMFSACEAGDIAVWKSGSWNCIRTLVGHKGPVYCVSVHPSGKVALSVGRDRILRTWNLETGYMAFRQKLKEAAVLVQWSPSAIYYALAFRTSIEVYAVESGAVVSSISVGKAINSFVFPQDGLVAVASEMPSIQLFSIPSGELSGKLEGHTQRVKGLAVSPAGNLLFSASSDGCVRVWSLAQPLEKANCVSLYQTGSRLNCIALSSVAVQKQHTHSRPDGECAVRSTEESQSVPVGRLRTEERRSRFPRGSRNRLRQLRACSWQRTAGLPFSRQNVLSRRKHTLVRMTRLKKAGVQ